MFSNRQCNRENQILTGWKFLRIVYINRFPKLLMEISQVTKLDRICTKNENSISLALHGEFFDTIQNLICI